MLNIYIDVASSLRNGNVGQPASSTPAYALPPSPSTPTPLHPPSTTSPPLRPAPSTAASSSHPSHDIITLSDGSDEEEDVATGGPFDRQVASPVQYIDCILNWSLFRNNNGSSSRDNTQDSFVDLTEESELLIDLTGDSDTGERLAGVPVPVAAVPPPSRNPRNSYHGWGLHGRVDELLGPFSRDTYDAIGAGGRNGVGLGTPPDYFRSGRSTLARAHGFVEPVFPYFATRSSSRNIRTPFGFGQAGPSRSALFRHDNDPPRYSARVAEFDAEYSRLRDVRRREHQERMERIAQQYEAERSHLEDLNRPYGTASAYALEYSRGIASDPNGYPYAWYPPPTSYYSRYPVVPPSLPPPTPYRYPYAHTPPYYPGYDSDPWYLSAPPLPSPLPITINTRTGSTPLQNPADNGTSFGTNSTPRNGSAPTVEYSRPLSPWLNRGSPIQPSLGQSTHESIPVAVRVGSITNETAPSIPHETSSAASLVSPRSRAANRPPRWITSPSLATEDNTLRHGRPLCPITQRATPATSPLRHGYTASRLETTANSGAPSSSTPAPVVPPSASEVSPSSNPYTTTDRVLDQLPQLTAVLRRLIDATQTPVSQRVAMQRVVDAHDSLIRLLNRSNRNAGLASANTASWQSRSVEVHDSAEPGEESNIDHRETAGNPLNTTGQPGESMDIDEIPGTTTFTRAGKS